MEKTFQSEYKNRDQVLKSKLTEWRRESSILRIDKPSNIARARTLGYKDKQGVVVARVRVKKGLRKVSKPHGGRKPSKYGRFFTRGKSLQSIAEERAASKFSNCEVLNSYYVGEDGTYKFFEVILLDKSNPVIMADKTFQQVISQNKRVFRGLTSAGRKHRGLVRSKMHENSMPSVRANR